MVIWTNLVCRLEDKFKELCDDERKLKLKTLLGTGEIIMRLREDIEKVSEEDQTIYRSGVGMLLYLIKHSRLDIANATRELAKVMDGATKAHMKGLIREINFIRKTKDWKFKFEPDFME